MRAGRIAVALFFTAAAAMAQPQPIFDVDDFVDPRQHDASLLALRLVVGGVKSYVDDNRPLRQNAGFLHLANSFYWSNFQVDYKRSQVRGAHAPPPVQVCNCDPPVYFPTPPLPDEVPAPPPPGGRDTLQFGWYAGREIKLRYRLSVTSQNIDTDPTFPNTQTVAQHLHGHERSVGFEGDTHVPIIGFGTINVVRTVRTNTADDRADTEIDYTGRFPGFAYKRILLRGMLTVGGVGGRGARGVNVVNPLLEAFWHDQKTRANFHLAWSPTALRSGRGWQTHQQIGFFVERGVVMLFPRHSAPD